MASDYQLFPDQASTLAPQVDALYYFLIAVSVAFTALIFFLVVYFAVKYRRRSDLDRPKPIHGDARLEFVWIAVPLGLTMVMFVWGASLFFDLRRPPSDALEIYAVSKQWMWKFQHPGGQREINELHVPVGRPVKLTMTSEDVIHSWFVPAFRTKMDVLPGRYTMAWFEATKPGSFHLFCAEYCGTDHSHMTGRIVVMTPAQYERWLSNSNGAGAQSLASVGEQLFHQQRCDTCHMERGKGTGPALAGLFGNDVALRGGNSVTADETYIRESILKPNAKLVAGYAAVMPTYAGLITEDNLIQLVSYVKALGQDTGGEAQ